MNKIVSFYNQNKKTIWVVVLTIIAVFSLIQVFNNYYKNKAKDKSGSANNSTTTYSKNSYSVVTGQEINNNTAEKSSELIKSFIDYCNDGKVEEAYNMLSIDCKEELYPTINDFTEKYYKRIFIYYKSYDSTLWISTKKANTYRVEIMTDLLATGKKEATPIEEYYTIVSENEEYKININRYIGKEELNVSRSQNNINITILSRKTFMDYEKYEVKVENSTGEKLLFNTKQNVDSIYLNDENGLNYIAFLNEIANSELLVLNGDNKTLDIRFNRGYKPTIKIQRIVFNDIKINSKDETESIEIPL